MRYLVLHIDRIFALKNVHLTASHKTQLRVYLHRKNALKSNIMSSILEWAKKCIRQRSISCKVATLVYLCLILSHVSFCQEMLEITIRKNLTAAHIRNLSFPKCYHLLCFCTYLFSKRMLHNLNCVMNIEQISSNVSFSI